MLLLVYVKKHGVKEQAREMFQDLEPEQLFVNKKVTPSSQCYITVMHLNNYIIKMMDKLSIS